MEISENTWQVLEALNSVASTSSRYASEGCYWRVRFYAEPGRVRDRIYYETDLMKDDGTVAAPGRQRFVRCFVERGKDGNILYASGWNTPVKWKDGFGSEFSVEEFEQYAEFTRDGGWGYKGDRARWEAK